MAPIVAKSPAGMDPSRTKPTSSFTLEKDRLTLIQKSPDGKSETTIILNRVE